MKIEQIDVIMPIKTQYGVLYRFTQALVEAFQRMGIGVTTLVIDPNKKDPKAFFEQVLRDQPDFTLAFNGILPDENGLFLCDLLKIPHVACLVDSPVTYMDLTKSPLSIIANPDRSASFFLNKAGFDNTCFMPHGTERDLQAPPPSSERPYDVVFLGSCIDPQAIQTNWQKLYPPPLVQMLEECAAMVLSDQRTPYADILTLRLQEALKRGTILKNQIDYIALLVELEYFVRGKDRLELLKAIHHHPVHIFGDKFLEAKWEEILPHRSNITLHPAVLFDQALDIMRQSKIVLNSTPTIKHGGHERIFYGMASNAAILTNETTYAKNAFDNGENILLYQPSHWEEVDDLIGGLLQNPEKRISLATQGHAVTMAEHTWDERAARLIEQVEPLLEKINAAH